MKQLKTHQRRHSKIARRDSTVKEVSKTIFRRTADRQEQDPNIAEEQVPEEQVPEQQRGCEKQVKQRSKEVSRD